MARLSDSITYGNHAITGDADVGGTLTVDGTVYVQVIGNDLNVTGYVRSNGAGFRDATGNYGTIRVDDDRSTGGWAGYAIRDDWVLMSDGSPEVGIYNDTDNEWAIRCFRNAGVELWHNGSEKLTTTAAGVTVTGTLSGNGSGLTSVDADTVDGYNTSQNNVGNTVAVRDGSGDFHCRLLRPEYTSLNTGGNISYFWTSKGIGTGDNYLRPTTTAEVRSVLGVNGKLDTSSKAADSNLLDGINSSSFVRSDTTDDVTGWLRVTNTNGIESRYGIQGGYGDTGGSGSNWGVTIWAMGNAYNGSGYSSSHTVGNYSMSWLRTGHASSNGNVGEGFYLYSQNAYRGGMGTSGFHTTGNLLANGNITAYSDIRVKTNIEVIPEALNKIGKLSGYTFNRTDVQYDEQGEPTTPVRQTGVIAQELIKVLPEAVTGGPTDADPDAMYSVAYGNMVGLLIEGLKEERSKREALEDRIARLEELLNA